MKFLLLLFTLCLSTSAFSWEVVKKKDEYFLVNKDKKSYAIVSEGGDPSFVRTETLSEELERIIYKAGVAGTSELKVIHRALLINKSEKKVLGDFPVSYEGMDGKNRVQVKWKVGPKEVLIEDPETETSQKIPVR